MAYANMDLGNATYTGPGASITIPVLTKLGEFINILDYGGDPTGTVDNTTAFNNAIAAVTSTGGTLFFPPGVFLFSSSVVIALPSPLSIALVGAGQDTTLLKFTSLHGIQVNYSTTATAITSTFHVRDLSITTTGTGVGNGVGLALVHTAPGAIYPGNSPPNDITRVGFHGFPAVIGTQRWGTCLDIQGISNVNIFGCNFAGSTSQAGRGITMEGASSSAIPVLCNLSMSNFIGFETAFYYGNYAQGVAFNQCNFTGSHYGINVASGSTNLNELTVIGSQLACSSTSINIGTEIYGVQIIGNQFYTYNAAPAIELAAEVGYSIIGNYISENTPGGYGIVVASSLNNVGGIISGNTIVNQNIGVWLQSNSRHANVQSNYYANNSTNVRNDAGAFNTVGGGSP